MPWDEFPSWKEGREGRRKERRKGKKEKERERKRRKEREKEKAGRGLVEWLKW
jgi:hypothetical protein